ncbi:MAG TPA: Uma2 family endonuclease [Phycisphaerae bacterium]|nr:Uma2 family endonuclease [Phycisphaerae bacterium]
MTTLIEPQASGSAAENPRSTETLADLLHRLGDIPPERVRLHPFPGTATEQDVIDIDAHENRLFELVDGVLVEKAMGYWESYLAMRLGRFLGEWVEPRGLGFLTGEAGMMRVLPKQVRMPDVAFVTPARFPGGKPTPGPVPDVCPDLAVEVVSEGNTKREIERKRKEYFKGGTILVWVVDPPTRTVAVYTGPETFHVLTLADQLDGGTVLPGFILPLKTLFAGLPDDYK